MQYGTIAEMPKRVSRVGQGTMMLGRGDDEADFALLDATFDAGITLYDAAHVYGGGRCDRVFGQWIKRRGNREEIVIHDKCCHPNADRNRVTPFDIEADLHDLLARLGEAYIDILSFHRDEESQPVGPLVETMNRLIDQGLIRAWGASNWTHKRIAEANAYAESHSLRGCSVASPQFSLAECLEEPWGGNCVTLTGHDEADARAWYRENQMAVLAWSSLCGGLFSGRFTRENLGTFTSDEDKRCIRCFCSEENFQRLDRAKELAAKKNATLAQIGIAWVIHSGLNTYPLMAAWTVEQASENAAAGDIELSADEVAWLDLQEA